MGYVIGHLITPLTKLIQKLNKAIFKKYKDIILDNGSNYEWLRLHRPEAGGICAKLRAEFTMYNSFSAVFLILSIISILSLLWWHFFVLLILTFLMTMRGAEAEGTFKNTIRKFFKNRNL